MSRRSDENLRGIPMKPYDLIREGIIVLGAILILVVVLAAVAGSPDYVTVRGQDVAERQPIAYLRTATNTLAGNSEIQTYGPPYTSDFSNAQSVFGIAPARWFGVTHPIDPIQDFILQPLARAAAINSDLTGPLETYQSATESQQQAWTSAYLAALDEATVVDGEVQVPSGDYGPVPAMMNGMLDLGRAGLLEGALESGVRLPYTLDFTRSLLFFEGDVYEGVAASLDMLGERWGISHETGPYPGAWWLWPYTFLYQIPPLRDAFNADLVVVVVILILFVLLPLLLTFIPILNRLPRWMQVYRIIWRDWYRRSAPGKAPQEAE